jgi:hypothetical protein
MLMWLQNWVKREQHTGISMHKFDWRMDCSWIFIFGIAIGFALGISFRHYDDKQREETRINIRSTPLRTMPLIDSANKNN